MVSPIKPLPLPPLVAPALPKLVSTLMRRDVTLERVSRGETVLSFGAFDAIPSDALLKLKNTLADLGLKVPADGAFKTDRSAATTAVGRAVTEVQAMAGLPQTGKLDDTTIAAIDGLWLKRGKSAIPVPTDAGFFTDADELGATIPSKFRGPLGRALRSGGTQQIIGLQTSDLMLATPSEKATLFTALVKNGAGTGEQQFMLEELQRPTADGAKVLDALAAVGKLNPLINAYNGATAARLISQLPALVTNAQTGAAVVTALLKVDSPEHRLAVHHLFDRARADRILAPMLKLLEGPAAINPVVRDLVSQASPTIRPQVIAHRAGDPLNFPENTIAALESGLSLGMEAVEIDIAPTRDEIVLWHDVDPENLVSRLREDGMEGPAGPDGQGYKPVRPEPLHPARRPIYELTTSSFMANYGYAKRDGNVLTKGKRDPKIKIPTFKQVAKWVKAHPQLKRVVLDIKLPADKPDVQLRFAKDLRAQLEAFGLKDKVLLMSNNVPTLKLLKAQLPGVAATIDVEIVSIKPDASDYSAVAEAAKLGNDVASVGKPVLGIGGYSAYLEVLQQDRARISTSGKKTELIAWTINDELQMREVIAKGVDGILTDKPDLLRKVISAYGWP